MLRDPNRPRFDPKHRIVGAIVLVAVAVIVIPMILTDDKPPVSDHVSSETSATTQPPGEGENQVLVTPVPGPVGTPPPDQASAPGPAPTEEPAPAPSAALPAATPPPSTADVDPKPPATDAPVKAPTKTAAIKPATGWLVQVGTFSSAKNAERLRTKLRKRGHTVSLETVKLSSGKALRLRVGPFRDRPSALKAQAQIQKDVGVRGVVLATP